MLFLLPECLVRAIVGEWLEVKAIGRLDSAVCSNSCRDELLCVLSSIDVVTPLASEKGGLLLWILLRNITVPHVEISRAALSYMNRSFVRELICRDASSITSVELAAKDPHMLRVVADHCRNLTEFRCSKTEVSVLCDLLRHNSSTLQSVSAHIDDEGECSVPLPNFPQLTLLALTLSDEGQMGFVGSLVANAARLLKLSIGVERKDAVFTTPLLSSSCAHLRTLRLFQVDCTSSALSATVQLCPNVANLELEHCFNLTDDDVFVITTHLRTLQFVRIVQCARVTDAGLSHLSTHFTTTLQTVWLEQISNITRAGIDAFRHTCPTVALEYVEQCHSVRELKQSIRSNKASILKVVFRVGDSTAQSVVSTTDSVRVVVIHRIDKNSFSSEGFIALCSKMPQLHTAVCSKHMLCLMRELVSALPHIRVTTDTAVCDVDVMDLPV